VDLKIWRKRLVECQVGWRMGDAQAVGCRWLVSAVVTVHGCSLLGRSMVMVAVLGKGWYAPMLGVGASACCLS